MDHLERRDGSFTANPAEPHQLLREDWKTVFNLFDEDLAQAPTMADFLREYGQEMRQAARACHIPRLTGRHLWEQAGIRRADAAGGGDA